MSSALVLGGLLTCLLSTIVGGQVLCLTTIVVNKDGRALLAAAD